MTSIQTKQKRGGWMTAAAVAVVASMALAATPATAHDAGRSDEHGTILLSFEQTESGCRVSMEARNVDVQQATLTIEREVRKGVATDHEEELQGTPEEGEGFRFEAGPFDYEPEFPQQIFVLHWGDREHALTAEWSGEACANTPYLRIYEDPEAGAVTGIDGCELFVEGRHVSDEGRIEIEEFHNDRVVVNRTVTAEETEADESGHRFLVGPVELELSGRHALRFFEPGAGEAQARLFFQVSGCSTEPPVCPENLEVHQFEDQNTLTWDAVQDALRYNVYRAEAGGEMERIDQVGHPLTSSDDRNVEDDTAYEYRVTAVGEQGESEGCPTVLSVRGERFECPPATLDATANPDESITLTAHGLDQPVSLLRSEAGGEFVQVDLLTEEEPAFRDTDTQAGVTYSYKLVTEGETCAQVTVTAIPVFPTLVAGSLAAGASLLGYAALRRRR